MACSFRGAGSPSYSLEIQWWYTKKHTQQQQQRQQQQQQQEEEEEQHEEEQEEHRRDHAFTSNQVGPLEHMSKDATKISVVKVAGSNISHKLRLSSVKPSDEGTYECRVIDFSGSVPQHHRARAYLRVGPHRRPPALGPAGSAADRDQASGPQQQTSSSSRHQGVGRHQHAPLHGYQAAGKELKRQEAGGGGGGGGVVGWGWLR
ncbi:hypothetical protein CRUP_017905 [Coryphaenoides rupestris]|nr:hypothetical protein CRUP_017905 [Coryphaenoides rupestris]